MMSPHFWCAALSVGPQMKGSLCCLSWPLSTPDTSGVISTYGLVSELVRWQMVTLVTGSALAAVAPMASELPTNAATDSAPSADFLSFTKPPGVGGQTRGRFRLAPHPAQRPVQPGGSVPPHHAAAPPR